MSSCMRITPQMLVLIQLRVICFDHMFQHDKLLVRNKDNENYNVSNYHLSS